MYIHLNFLYSSGYGKALCIFIWISSQLIIGCSERTLPIEITAYFLRFYWRCRGTKLQKKSASSLKVLPEPLPPARRKLLHRGTAFFALRSCRVRVCSWIRLPPYLCQWFWKIGVCQRTSGWHAPLLKHFTPAAGQIMGFTLETGLFCLVPNGEIPVGYCFDCCCFILVSALQGMKLVMTCPRKH